MSGVMLTVSVPGAVLRVVSDVAGIGEAVDILRKYDGESTPVPGTTSVGIRLRVRLVDGDERIGQDDKVERVVSGLSGASGIPEVVN